MIVVARCPRCHGWTMFHADAESTTAQQWVAIARRGGDLISTYEDKETVSSGEPCPDASGKDAGQRNCPIRPQPEAAWSFYP